MNLILFFVFLFCDLLTVSACWFSFGRRSTYREGMLMGVHIPADCVHDPEVEKISQKAEKIWLFFQWANLAAGLAVCFLCFRDVLFFLTVWTIWLGEYIAGLYGLILVPHRQMYRLKIRRGWIQENSRYVVRVDTAVSAADDKLALNWKWHLPILFFMFTSVVLILKMRQKYRMDPAEELVVWILFATCSVVCVLFLTLHIVIASRQNRVYSENSSVNLMVNRVMKRAWTKGLTAASWMNGAAWIFLASVWYIWGMSVPFWGYGMYMFLSVLAGAAFVIPVMGSAVKKKKILEEDTESYVTDDDEYWKNGWYNNPDDRRILVQDRFSSVNYTFNFGRPGVKIVVTVLSGMTLVFVLAVFLWCYSAMSAFERADVMLSEKSGVFTVEAAGYECRFSMDEVCSAVLKEEMPDDAYTRTNGGSTDQVDIGYFRGNKTGTCMLFLYHGYSPVLEIRLDDGMVLFVNSREKGEAEEWYEMLSRKDRKQK